jgi:uncharacterized Zn-finger protein
MSGPIHETSGDDDELPCPWCGERMNMSDDERWANDGGRDVCEHCHKPFRLRTITSVVTRATRLDIGP